MPADSIAAVVRRDPDILGGTPVFAGTRVPLQNLLDALAGGEGVDEFLEGFPTVRREQALAVVAAGRIKLLELAAELPCGC